MGLDLKMSLIPVDPVRTRFSNGPQVSVQLSNWFQGLQK